MEVTGGWRAGVTRYVADVESVLAGEYVFPTEVRICANEDCKKRLSRGNPNALCFACQRTYFERRLHRLAKPIDGVPPGGARMTLRSPDCCPCGKIKGHRGRCHGSGGRSAEVRARRVDDGLLPPDTRDTPEPSPAWPECASEVAPAAPLTRRECVERYRLTPRQASRLSDALLLQLANCKTEEARRLILLFDDGRNHKAGTAGGA